MVQMTTSASHKKTKFLTLSLYFITIYRMSDREGERESGGTGSESERESPARSASHDGRAWSRAPVHEGFNN